MLFMFNLLNYYNMQCVYIIGSEGGTYIDLPSLWILHLISAWVNIFAASICQQSEVQFTEVDNHWLSYQQPSGQKSGW